MPLNSVGFFYQSGQKNKNSEGSQSVLLTIHDLEPKFKQLSLLISAQFCGGTVSVYLSPLLSSERGTRGENVSSRFVQAYIFRLKLGTHDTIWRPILTLFRPWQWLFSITESLQRSAENRTGHLRQSTHIIFSPSAAERLVFFFFLCSDSNVLPCKKLGRGNSETSAYSSAALLSGMYSHWQTQAEGPALEVR